MAKEACSPDRQKSKRERKRRGQVPNILFKGMSPITSFCSAPPSIHVALRGILYPNYSNAYSPIRMVEARLHFILSISPKYPQGAKNLGFFEHAFHVRLINYTMLCRIYYFQR
jgi:hypothetical protein